MKTEDADQGGGARATRTVAGIPAVTAWKAPYLEAQYYMLSLLLVLFIIITNNLQGLQLT